MALYSREQIRAGAKKAGRTVDVPCPELGDECEIRLRQMRGGQLIRYQAMVAEHQAAGTEGELAIVLLQMCAEGEDGEPLWPADDEGSVAEIEALPGDVMTRLVEKGSELNSPLTEKAVEVAEKN